mgnify:CR=1 FL=1
MKDITDSLKGSAPTAGSCGNERAQPTPLPSSQEPVPAFDAARLLPPSLRGYVVDHAERLQVDGSFIAVPVIAALGSVLGNRIGLMPKAKDDWIEYPNLWGAIVGRPSTLKSPSLSVGLAPMMRLQSDAAVRHKDAMVGWSRDSEIRKIKKSAARESAKKAIKCGDEIDADSLVEESSDEPVLRRFVTNDATPEALHSILIEEENATGVMVMNDELSGLIARLNDPDRGGAHRAFLLSGWTGNQSAVVDRIGRGQNLRVEKACVTVLGGIQPGKLAPLVDAANRESIADDGWIQRFSLIVSPDSPSTYQHVDRDPDDDAWEQVNEVFERAEATRGVVWKGAKWNEFKNSWYLRFESKAAEKFAQWMEHWTCRIRAGEWSPALESHFMKYRKLVPALALIFHVAGDGEQGEVGEESLDRALDWLDYLTPHALRIYGSGQTNTVNAAQRILSRLRKGDLPPRFRARDLKRNCWSGLTDEETVKVALELLQDHDWLTEERVHTGGRSTVEFIAHPSIFDEFTSRADKTDKRRL